jgi:hypothetical protein
LPLQHRVTATWRDGSAKWALLDFQTTLAAHETKQLTLKWGAKIERGPIPNAIQIEETPDAVWMDTRALKFSISRKRLGILDGRLQQSLTLAKEFSNITTGVSPPDEVAVEEGGPLRATVKVAGWIDDGGTNKLVRYLVRITAFAGSRDVDIQHTVTQLSPSVKMLWVRDLSLILKTEPSATTPFAIGGATTHTGALANASVTLTQLKESAYSVTQMGAGEEARPVASGLRASGWFEFADTFVAVQDFWQQFPKAVTFSTNGIRIGLYPAEAEEPFDMDAGVAKTHRLLVSFRGAPNSSSARSNERARAELEFGAPGEKLRAFEQPLFAQATTQWYCESKVFGDLAPSISICSRTTKR